MKNLARTYKMPFETDATVDGYKDVASDPTIAHATANEIEAEENKAANGHSVETATNGISNMQVTDDAANSVAASHWDTRKESSGIQDWVQVPRNPTETETGTNATPAEAANTQSWADDHPETTAKVRSAPLYAQSSLAQC